MFDHMKASFQTDPDILDGTVCFAGTRIPAHAVFEFIHAQKSDHHIASEYPSLSLEQIRVAWLLYEAAVDTALASHGGQQ